MGPNEDYFRRIVSRLKISGSPSPAHRGRLRRRMLEVFSQARRRYESAGPVGRAWRVLGSPQVGRSRTARLAAVAVCVAAVAVAAYVIGTLALGLWRSGAPAPTPTARITWPQVLEPIRAAHQVAFVLTRRSADAGDIPHEILLQVGGRCRIAAGDKVYIVDRARQKVMILSMAARQARRDKLAGHPVIEAMAAALEDLAALPVAARASETLDLTPDGAVEVFEVHHAGRDWKVWADARTAKPIKVSVTAPAKGQTWVLADLDFERRFDPELLLMQAPEAFTIVGDHAGQ